jgi:polyisoprenoid-binding protein YceI
MTTTTQLSELTGDYIIDAAHSKIGFVAQDATATKVHGQFDDAEGSAYLDGDDPTKSSARLAISAKSVQTRNQLRDRHLRSKFLDADHHPVIAFASTTVEQLDEVNFRVSGDMTIRGVTKPVTVDFELIGAGSDASANFRVEFAGRATINRNDWGVNWNAVTGVLVRETVHVELSVTAIRQTSRGR